MAVTAKVVTGQLSADSGSPSVNFTSSGFGTPDAAIVIITNASATNPATQEVLSVGVWDGTNRHCVANYSNDAAATTYSSRYKKLDKIGFVSTYNGSAHSTSADYDITNTTDGVTVTLETDATGLTREATVVLIKGVTNKKVGVFNLPGSTSKTAINSIGFKSDLVFLLDVGLATGTTEGASGTISIGVVHNDGTDTVTQAVANYNVADNVSTSFVAHYVSASNAIQLSNIRTCVISDFDADGFSVTNTNTSVAEVVYLALELPDPDDAWVGVVTTLTGSGPQDVTTGFQPVVVGLFGSTATALDTETDTGALTIAVSDGTTARSLIAGAEDNLSVSNNSFSRSANDALNLRFDDDTVDTVAAVSMASGKFTLTYSDYSASARKIVGWAIGDSGGGAVTHDSSGALSADSAVIAGASVHSIPHASSGALSAQSATIAGSSTHVAIHASSGALSAQSAVIDGTGENTASGVVTHLSSGALSAQSAVIDGTSAHVVNHQSSGALQASDAVLDGASIHNLTHVTSGDLIAGNAEIYGLYSGGTAVVTGGGIGHGGFKRKPRLIKIEEAENPEEVIEQIEQAFSETTKKPAKKRKNVVVKSKPVETKEEAPFDWLSYYQSQARQVKEQQDMNDLIAKARARINEIQEQETLAKYQQMIIREEEEFLLLLMAA